MTVEVPADAPVISSDGVAIYIAGTVQFRVGGDNLSIAMAAESLLRKSEEEIRNVVYNLMRNQMTATIQKSTGSEVRQNSSAFLTAMSEGVREQLGKLGLCILSSSFECDFLKSFGAWGWPDQIHDQIAIDNISFLHVGGALRLYWTQERGR